MIFQGIWNVEGSCMSDEELKRKTWEGKLASLSSYNILEGGWLGIKLLQHVTATAKAALLFQPFSK